MEGGGCLRLPKSPNATLCLRQRVLTCTSLASTSVDYRIEKSPGRPRSNGRQESTRLARRLSRSEIYSSIPTIAMGMM